MKGFKKYFILLCCCLFLLAAMIPVAKAQLLPLKIAENKRSFVTSDGKPFFWLGDTGWLLFVKLNREEVDSYLEDRKAKGFNVIQVMVIHDVHHAVNVYGDSALINHNVAKPKTTPGSDFNDRKQYDFWDHVDYVVNKAAEKGLYLALVPIWGSNVKSGLVKEAQAKVFARFLAERYKNKTNIIWVNGGDIKGSEGVGVWNVIGNTLRSNDPNHLITFHPRGRSTSSTWFHQKDWLDFNMFQSGHKDYAQDTVIPRIGEDNWKFVQTDYALRPVKPTLDGEPIYENIPHGLHDTLGPKWKARDVRRYAYWSVFAGGCGFTYGHNAVMQFYTPGHGAGAYGCKEAWQVALNDSGAKEMVYVKNLILSKPFFERIPDQSLIAGKQGEKYNFLIATRGKEYAFIYSYTGGIIPVVMGKIAGKKIKASWYDPRNGEYSLCGEFENNGIHDFYPPKSQGGSNDWVLVLESLKG